MTPEPFTVEPRVAVLQDAARRHYAVPVAMQRAGILERVFTEWYTRDGSLESFATECAKRVKPELAQRLAERFSPELDASKVITKPSLVLSQAWNRRKFKTEIEFNAWRSDMTARWVLDKGFGEANALYGFVRNIFPGLCATARSYGLKVITDQIIAPCVIEHAEAAKQLLRFPAWSQEKSAMGGRILNDVERGTWENSDVITCMSDYVRDGLISCGVSPNKIVVVPYPVDRTAPPPPDRRGRGGPVTVGFVGQIGLRKGAPYFFEVARRLDPQKIKFVMVGPLKVQPDVVEQFRDAVQLPGPMSRGQIPLWMRKFDIFLFPTTCEGSAGAVTEAMMAGLPIVTSPNCGSLVRHGQEGFLCAYDDSDRMASYISTLAADEELRHHMGIAARARVEAFDLDHYGQSFKEIFSRLLNPGGKS